MKMRAFSVVLCLWLSLQAGCSRRETAEYALRKGLNESNLIGRVRWFTKVIAADPEWAVGYKGRGASYIPLGRLKEAVEDLTQAINLEPEDAQPYLLRGEAYYLMQEYGNTIEDCTQAIALVPDLIGPYSLRASAYTIKGRFDEAIADYDKTISLAPHATFEAQARANRALACTMTGRCREAIADCTRAILLEPNCDLAYSNRATAHYWLKEYDLAWADVRSCRQIGGAPPELLLKLLKRDSGRSE